MFARYFKSKGDKIPSKKKSKEISLIVANGENEEPCVVKVPKYLLVEHSSVFKRMYQNGEFKKSRKINLEEITAVGLMKIAEYLKKGTVCFQNHHEAIEALKAAYIYEVKVMQNICSDFLITIIDIGNVCEIYEFASAFSFHELEYHCLRFIDEHAVDILKSPGFLTLKRATVMDIIRRHSLNIPSEVIIFGAVLTWGVNECLRQGVDAEKTEEIIGLTRSLFERVRFLTMTQEEMADPVVDKFYKLLNSDDSSYRRRSLLNSEPKPRSNTLDSCNLQPRKHETEYVYDLEAHGYDEHAVKNGESFCLKVEALKGKVFLTAITVSFDTFVNTKNTSCLYVALTATNVQTFEQKSARGTFLNNSEDTEVKFPSPLVVKESETVEIVLNVKRAENICPMIMKSDIQIAVPEMKEVAMKITPSNMTGDAERSLFKGIKYFF